MEMFKSAMKCVINVHPHLDTEIAPVYIVPKEEVARVGRRTSHFKQLHQVEKLAVDISTHCGHSTHIYVRPQLSVGVHEFGFLLIFHMWIFYHLIVTNCWTLYWCVHMLCSASLRDHQDFPVWELEQFIGPIVIMTVHWQIQTYNSLSANWKNKDI